MVNLQNVTKAYLEVTGSGMCAVVLTTGWVDLETVSSVAGPVVLTADSLFESCC